MSTLRSEGNAVTVRPVLTMDEYRSVEAIQRQVWAMSHDLEVVPLHLLVTATRSGGMLMGAFRGEAMVGFVFGFPGLTAEGKLKQCSHMMGVLPGAQSSGIGTQLKLAQRAFVLAQGLDLITWTYDPLQSRNAYLNIAKLGAVCRTYHRDFYGELVDGLNAGLPSDRLEVEWWIASERVARRLGAAQHRPRPVAAVQVNETQVMPGGLVAPGTLYFGASAATIQVEIPAEFQAVRDADPGLAREWRIATRQLFEAYFEAGYSVVDFVSCPVDGLRRSFYLLDRD
jgi:predicted GNAT superfamily acetyltransferase